MLAAAQGCRRTPDSATAAAPLTTTTTAPVTTSTATTVTTEPPPADTLPTEALPAADAPPAAPAPGPGPAPAPAPAATPAPAPPPAAPPTTAATALNNPALAQASFVAWWNARLPAYVQFIKAVIDMGLLEPGARPVWDCGHWSNFSTVVGQIPRTAPPALPYPYKSLVANWDRWLNFTYNDVRDYWAHICDGDRQYVINVLGDVNELLTQGDAVTDRVKNGPVSIVPE
jgi:hypothetical protein